MSHARGKGFWLYLYKHVPGFAPVAEWAYAFTAAHRPAFYRVSLLLWGKDHEPPRYELVSFLFLRLLGLIYLSAFVSFAVQAQGLIGSHGIQPLAEFVNNVAARFGPERFYLAPMVFWLDDSDAAIAAVCWAGAGLSLLLVVLPLLVYFVAYIPYLQLGHAIATVNQGPGYGWSLGELQSQMFGYHFGLQAGHPAASPWWSWPLVLKPVYWYFGAAGGGVARGGPGGLQHDVLLVGL